MQSEYDFVVTAFGNNLSFEAKIFLFFYLTIVAPKSYENRNNYVES
uniref:Uncharacterized protein n=1 Tax=uncultured Desulfobacterium sp. TaxID=201089 RepID=E1YMK5_9BACT|nr:unknown protein [uncultured Desulfobacterium sp.]